MRVPLSVLLIASIATCGLGCSKIQEKISPEKKPAAATQLQATSVTVAKAVEGSIQETASLTGHLSAISKADVFSRVAGRVLSVEVREGDKVAKGDPLIILDSKALRASQQQVLAAKNQAIANEKQAIANLSAAEAKVVQARESVNLTDTSSDLEIQRVRQSVFLAEANTASAQAEYDDALHNLKRQRGLFSQDAVSSYAVEQAELREQTSREKLGGAKSSEKAAREGLRLAEANKKQVSIQEGDVKTAHAAVAQAKAGIEQARAAIEQAQAQFNSLQVDIDDMTLRSPITGIVVTRKVEPGQSVGASGGSALMQIVDNSNLEMVAPLDERFSAYITPGTPLKVSTTIGKPVDAKVIDIIPASDPSTHSIKVRLSIPNEKGTLVEGTYATATLPVRLLTGIVVPRTTVNSSGKEVFAMVCVDNKAKKVPLKEVYHNETHSIVEGIQVGDQLVSSGALNLADGQDLEIRQEADKK